MKVNEQQMLQNCFRKKIVHPIVFRMIMLECYCQQQRMTILMQFMSE